jgi:hypothetical protein
MRKIVQVSMCPVPNTNSTQCNALIVVLCDDGTLWQSDDRHPEWMPLNPIPQEDQPHD